MLTNLISFYLLSVISYPKVIMVNSNFCFQLLKNVEFEKNLVQKDRAKI